jgi:hypothetical protein
MQQRQLRLGDILDDYCPRERRLTNHAVVAMVGDAVKQTRCTTCEAEHEYKHAKVPRQRRKGEEPAALYSQVLAGGPKRITPERAAAAAEPANESNGRIDLGNPSPGTADEPTRPEAAVLAPSTVTENAGTPEGDEEPRKIEDGPVHRPLIRATLPRAEGQPPPTRPAPEFTIRQPGGRPNRFRGRPRDGQSFQGNRSGGPMGGGSGRGGALRPGGRPPHGTMNRSTRRHDAGRKRSK